MGDARFSEAVQLLDGLSGTDGLHRPFLHGLTVDGASVATLGSPLGSETVAGSDDLALRIDELQFDLGEGPCWDSLATDAPVIEPDVRGLPRREWPAFSEAIRELELGALFAFPLRVGPLRLGAVDLYRVRPGTLSDDDQAHALRVADLVGRRVLRQAIVDAADHDDEGPRASRYTRRAVHQATGMVLAQLGTTPEDAHLLLQAHAFATGRPLREVAEEVLRGIVSFSADDDGIEDDR
ncbi:GAF and ANTAR domain-containing protein [Frigoribacterium salinisoli]